MGGGEMFVFQPDQNVLRCSNFFFFLTTWLKQKSCTELLAGTGWLRSDHVVIALLCRRIWVIPACSLAMRLNKCIFVQCTGAQTL